MAGHRTVPTVWVGPVRSHWTPMTISPFVWAGARSGVSSPAAPSASIVRKVRANLIERSPFWRTSVRERPHAEVAADVPPQAIQPLGLHDEEADDEGAEQHQAEVGNEIEHGGLGQEDPPEGLHGVPDDDG